MRGASLLGVLLIAKVLCLLGREVPASLWTPFAYLWQDLAVALGFLAVDTAARRRPWVGWGLYAVLCIYAAINVPLVRVTSSPLTLSMLRAARLTLAFRALRSFRCRFRATKRKIARSANRELKRLNPAAENEL